MQVTATNTITLATELGDIEMTRNEAVDLYISLGEILYPITNKPPTPAAPAFTYPSGVRSAPNVITC
jgi:hypothetical protein